MVLQSHLHIFFVSDWLHEGFMGYQHKKSGLTPENIYGTKRERLHRNPWNKSLKDTPLETRRKEANKPLFLKRYE